MYDVIHNLSSKRGPDERFVSRVCYLDRTNFKKISGEVGNYSQNAVGDWDYRNLPVIKTMLVTNTKTYVRQGQSSQSVQFKRPLMTNELDFVMFYNC